MSIFSLRLRIALLDDYDVVRHGLIVRLAEEPDFVVVGNFASSKQMVMGLRSSPADVLIVDYSLGTAEIDGMTLIRVLKSKFPESKILVLSAHYNPATIALALRVGASGFVGKSQQLSEIVHALRTVASGKTYLEPAMAHEFSVVIGQRASGMEAVSGSMLLHGAPLSRREREVIRCFLDGLTVTQIAEKFARSAKTISTQKSTAFRKLGIRTDNELFKIRYKLEQ